MHQRHPIKVDKGRALSAGNDRRMSGPTQVAFHKIYRQKRSILEKVKEHSNSQLGHSSNQSGHSSRQWVHSNSHCGYSSGQWRSDRVNSPRDSRTPSESKYSAGHGGFNPNRQAGLKETIKFGSQFSPFPGTVTSKNDREHSKRPYDRFAGDFASEPEFNALATKRQKVEFYKPTAPQTQLSPEFDHGKQKMALEETKWMYKNQKARMSGPYGVKQLMDGLQAHFLQEDLPIYQVCEGRLCKPITLKELANELQQAAPDSARMYSNQCPVSVKETTTRITDEIDFPPGFGGYNGSYSEKSSRIYLPNTTTSVVDLRCSTRPVPSLASEFEEAELSLPPGFEAGVVTHSEASELSGTPRRLSVGVGVVARREGIQVMHSSYEQPESVMQEQVHSSWQGSSPHLNASFPMQRARAGSEISPNRHTTWAYNPSSAKIPSFEFQSFPQPTMCIGLPVSKPAIQSWPISSNLPSCISKAEPYRFSDVPTQENNALATKEPAAYSRGHGPDPLSLILSELLAAVKKTYVNSVLSALIGEQLDCWLDAYKTWMGTSLGSDKESLPSGACDLSIKAGSSLENADINTCEASTATTNALDIFSEGRDARHSESSCLYSSHTVSSNENQSLSLMEKRKDAYLHSQVVTSDTLLLSNTEENGLGSRVSPSSGNAEDLSPDADKVDSCLSVDEACRFSSKSSSTHGIGPNQTSLGFKEELQHPSGEGIICADESNGRFLSGNISDAFLQEAEPPLLNTETKKGNVKSLKQIMLITSKLRTRRSSTSSLKKAPNRPCRKSKEAIDTGQIVEGQVSDDNDGCARTSIYRLPWHNGENHCHARGRQYEEESFKNGEIRMSTFVQSLTPSYERQNAPQGSFVAAGEETDAINLILSKASKRRLKVARSKIHKLGVFSVESLEGGDFVIEYFGELVRSKVADMREEHYVKSGIGNGYLFRIDAETVLDATKRGGLARFMNHSCDPNCVVKIVTMEATKRILFFAKRHIQAGEELTYRYKSVHGMQNCPCACGAPECRGAAIL